MFTMNGKLKYNDLGEYELCSEDRVYNISKFLNDVYYSKPPYHIDVCILDGCKIIFNEDGVLYKRKDKHGLYTYCVLGLDLEDVLFKNVNKFLEFTLYSQTLKGHSYDRKYYKRR